MNLDEKRVFSYLKTHFGEGVVHEPDGKVPPDFVVNSVTAIEARRLNQHFFNKGSPEGLEQFFFPIYDVFRRVLQSFDSSYQGSTYWVSINFQCPINIGMRQVKRSMEIALRDFLESEIPVLPLVLPVTDNIDITVNTSQPQNGRVFRPALSIDDNAGGFVIKNYTENLNHCICEKATKVRDYLANYQQWLLFLVDHMGWGLNVEETQDLVASISDIGVFDGVFIISADGVTLLASISR